MTRESNSWGNPPIVMDLSFLKEMPTKDANSIATREIPYAVSNLKHTTGPLAPIYLTSFDPKCDACLALKDFFNIGVKTSLSDFYLHITEESYLVRAQLQYPASGDVHFEYVTSYVCRTCFPSRTSSTCLPTPEPT